MFSIPFDTITEKLRALRLPSFDCVLGIACSGILPAALIAYKLQTDLKIIQIAYRNEDNTPMHPAPVLETTVTFPESVRSVLLVDDVSVSGKTMECALQELQTYSVQTLVLKGKADYVLFPEIKECVQWPWKSIATTAS